MISQFSLVQFTRKYVGIPCSLIGNVIYSDYRLTDILLLILSIINYAHSVDTNTCPIDFLHSMLYNVYRCLMFSSIASIRTKVVTIFNFFYFRKVLSLFCS